MLDTVVVKKPLLTEKSTHLINENNTYTFVVDRRARKDQIKGAIERLYSVKVENVRTITRKPKARAVRLVTGPMHATATPSSMRRAFCRPTSARKFRTVDELVKVMASGLRLENIFPARRRLAAGTTVR